MKSKAINVNKFNILFSIFVYASIICIELAAASQVPTYIVNAVGLQNDSISSALSISDNGQIVGWSASEFSNRKAFLYSDGVATIIGSFNGGTFSQAESINQHGQITGFGGMTQNNNQFFERPQAFIWENGVMLSIGALYCPCTYNRRFGVSLAHDINAKGQIVGESETVRGEWVRHAFLWEQGTMRDLGGGAGNWSISRAFGINDYGEAVGDFAKDAGRQSSFNRGAVLWKNDEKIDIGTLAGHDSSTALAINNNTEIVGWSGSFDGTESRAFLWLNGLNIDLGTLPGDTRSAALDININGKIVGWSGSPDGSDARAFLWIDGIMYDLNEIVVANESWVFNEATSINQNGQITGKGKLNGETRGFVLTQISTEQN